MLACHSAPQTISLTQSVMNNKVTKSWMYVTLVNAFCNAPDKNFTVVAKIIRTLLFSPTKNGFKLVISIFCCSVSAEVGREPKNCTQVKVLIQIFTQVKVKEMV